jgi:hypothetical protein
VLLQCADELACLGRAIEVLQTTAKTSGNKYNAITLIHHTACYGASLNQFRGARRHLISGKVGVLLLETADGKKLLL